MDVKSEKRNINLMFFAIIVISLLIRIMNLDIPIGNDIHAFRQTETAIIIQNYFQDGWSIFGYEMPLFGKPWKVLFECPIYQTAVYAVMRLLGQSNIDLWCRIVSLGIFYLSAFVLKKTVDLFTEGNVSIYVCCVYLCSIFNIYWSRAAMIDFMSVLFGILYVWGFYSWFLDGNRRRYGMGLFFGCLGYLLKATTMFPYVFLLAFLLINYWIKDLNNQKGQNSKIHIKEYLYKQCKRILPLFIICVIPVIVGMLWTYWADFVKGSSEYTDWLTSANLSTWNYGTWVQRCDLDNWEVIVERLVNFFGGKIVFIVLMIIYLAVSRRKNIIVLLYSFAACFMTIGILFNLYYVHDYYLMALSPLICLFYGVLLHGCREALWSQGGGRS